MRLDDEMFRQGGMNSFLMDSPDAHAERLRQALGIQKPVEFDLGGPQTILGGIRFPEDRPRGKTSW